MTQHSDPLRKSIENDERFHGMIGAWDHSDEPLSVAITEFANSLPIQYRGWAEMMRGWAYRIEREGRDADVVYVIREKGEGEPLSSIHDSQARAEQEMLEEWASGDNAYIERWMVHRDA